MEKKKTYRVTIELDDEEFIVSASTQAEARRKAISKLNRKKASSYISTRWYDNRKKIDVDEI